MAKNNVIAQTRPIDAQINACCKPIKCHKAPKPTEESNLPITTILVLIASADVRYCFETRRVTNAHKMPSVAAKWIPMSAAMRINA